MDGVDGTVWVEDLRAATGPQGRWPRFAPEALRLGVHAVLSIPVPTVHWKESASLDLYAMKPGTFGAGVRLLAEAYAEQTAVAVDHAYRVDVLRRAVRSRDVVGQAKGILMQRHGSDAAEAWTTLVEASQATNMKVVRRRRLAHRGPLATVAPHGHDDVTRRSSGPGSAGMPLRRGRAPSGHC